MKQLHPLHAVAGWWDAWAHQPPPFEPRMASELRVIADHHEWDGLGPSRSTPSTASRRARSR